MGKLPERMTKQSSRSFLFRLLMCDADEFRSFRFVSDPINDVRLFVYSALAGRADVALSYDGYRSQEHAEHDLTYRIIAPLCAIQTSKKLYDDLYKFSVNASGETQDLFEHQLVYVDDRPHHLSPEFKKAFRRFDLPKYLKMVSHLFLL